MQYPPARPGGTFSMQETGEEITSLPLHLPDKKDHSAYCQMALDNLRGVCRLAF